MTVAVDATTESIRTATTDPYSFSHTGRASGSGGVQGVLVFVINGATSANEVTSISYGGVALTLFTSARDTLTEPGLVQVWFGGSGLTGGTQTVAVDFNAATAVDQQIVVITLTAARDTRTLAPTSLEENRIDPRATEPHFGLTGSLSFCGLYSGLASVASTAILSGMTAIADHAFGSWIGRVDRQTTDSIDDFLIGYTAVSDDVGFISTTIAEVPETGGIAFVGRGMRNCLATAGSVGTVQFPPGIEADDIAILFVSGNVASSTITPDAETWTDIGTQQSNSTTLYSNVMRAWLGGTEDLTTLTVTFGTSQRWTLSLMVFRGVDTTAPVDDAAQHAISSVSTTITFPTATPIGDGDAILAFAAARGDVNGEIASYSGWGGPYTELVDQSGTGSAASNNSHAVGYRQLTAGAGAAINPANITTSFTQTRHNGHTVALKPVAAALTAVGQTVIAKWNVLAAIAQTEVYRWNVREAVPATLIARWNVRSLVGATRVYRWNVRTAIGKATAVLWNVRSAIGKATIYRWNVRSFVGQTRIVRWNVRTAVAPVTRIYRWNVRAAVGATRVYRWNVRAAIAKTLTAIWDVAALGITAVGKTTTAIWNVRATVAQTRIVRWNVRTMVGLTRQLVWHVRHIVRVSPSGNLAPEFHNGWRVLGTATVDADGVVTIPSGVGSARIKAYLGGASTSVYFSTEVLNELEASPETWGDGQAGWYMSGIYLGADGVTGVLNSLGAPSNGQARQNQAGLGAWGTPNVMGSFSTGPNVHWIEIVWQRSDQYTGTGFVKLRNPVISATNLAPSGSGWPLPGVTTRWNVRSVIGQAAAFLWNVRAAISQTDVLRWNVRAAAAKTTIARWNVRTFVGTTRVYRWNLRYLVGTTRIYRWNVRAAAGKTVTAIWNVAALGITSVGKTIAYQWNVRAAAGSSTTVRWNVRSAVAKITTVRWNVRTFVTDTLTAVWRVRSVVGATRAYRWNVGVPVGVVRVYRWNVRTAVGATRIVRWNVRSAVGSTRIVRWRVRTMVGLTRIVRWNVRQVVRGKNLLSDDQATFERGLGGWYGSQDTTAVQSTDAASEGTGSVKITKTAAGHVNVILARPATEGVTYTAVCDMLAATDVHSGLLLMVFKNAGGSTLLQVNGTGASLSLTQWRTPVTTGTAPAGTTQVWLYLYVGGAHNGDVFYADKVGFWEGSTTDWVAPEPGLTVRWRVAGIASKTLTAVWHVLSSVPPFGMFGSSSTRATSSEEGDTMVVVGRVEGSSELLSARPEATVAASSLDGGESSTDSVDEADAGFAYVYTE